MRIPILGVEIDNVGRTEAMAMIRKRMSEKKKTTVFTPNALMVYNATRDPEFRRILATADLNIPDGMGLLLASVILARPLSHRVAGIELGQSILSYAAQSGLRVFLLGGKHGVAEKAQKRLKAIFPALTVCGTHHGYFPDRDSPAIRRMIEDANTDILFVCLGSPRQEMWISRNAPRGVSVIAALGGSLDVWAGNLKRAPKLVSDVGLEWLWRMCLEPRRFSKLPQLCGFFLAVSSEAFQRKNRPHADAKLNNS